MDTFKDAEFEDDEEKAIYEAEMEPDPDLEEELGQPAGR